MILISSKVLADSVSCSPACQCKCIATATCVSCTVRWIDIIEWAWWILAAARGCRSKVQGTPGTSLNGGPGYRHALPQCHRLIRTWYSLSSVPRSGGRRGGRGLLMARGWAVRLMTTANCQKQVIRDWEELGRYTSAGRACVTVNVNVNAI